MLAVEVECTLSFFMFPQIHKMQVRTENVHIFCKENVCIDYQILCECLVLMFCVEDHNGIKSWTLLCFYPQLYLRSFHVCKAFV